MQEARYPDGRVERQFFHGPDDEAIQRKLIEAQMEALRNGATEVRQRPVGRNELCPCGSGMKFKKCCLDKAK